MASSGAINLCNPTPLMRVHVEGPALRQVLYSTPETVRQAGPQERRFSGKEQDPW